MGRPFQPGAPLTTMPNAPAYLFYDLNFHELARHAFHVRLRPYVIPSSGALLTTGGSVFTPCSPG